MAPFVLKFKGNKSFSPFSNLSDSDALTKTWRVCTKVASHLEQGQRLENLSWRLWHLHNLMVESDNAKSKREFKKLSKNMGERLDKDKGRSIEELHAPDFKANQSTDKLRQRAEEKEKHLGRTGIKGMTFTFPVDPTTNKTPGATFTTSTSGGTTKKPHHLKLNPPKDEFDESMEVINGATTGLVIDTNFNASLDAALTPTSSFITTAGTTDAANDLSRVNNRTHYRGHHDSISSVSSALSAFPTHVTSPISPDVAIASISFNSTAQASKKGDHQQQENQPQPHVLRFPSVFQNDFTPIALLCPAPSVKQGNSYGEAIGFAGLANSTNHADVFGITRPTFEYSLDELMNAETNSDVETSTSGGWAGEDGCTNLTNSVSSLSIPTPVSASISMASFSGLQITPLVVGASPDAMQGVQTTLTNRFDDEDDNDDAVDAMVLASKKSPALILPSQSAPASPALFALSSPAGANADKEGTIAPFPPLTLPKGSMLPGPSPTPSPAPAPSHHSIRRRYSTTNAPTSSAEGKKSGRQPSATAPRNSRTSYGNSAPGGVKSECANCGANSTPLWRRGLNDELNCNACGLFAKLHKRPRPKSLRGSVGEGGTRHPGWASKGSATEEAGEPVSCYNCATIATPLWRKDEEGRTLCNACGLYLKLHGERRPSSMKSDVIRKRSRHDARRGTSTSATPSASPGASRRTSPTPPPGSSRGNNNSSGTRKSEDLSFGLHSPIMDQAVMTSPYATTSHSFEFSSSSSTGHGQQDNSPVDLMSMNHSMGTDGGVDPTLGGMTFSPGATYQETLQYPGPFSLNYFYGQYGDAGHGGHGVQDQNQQQQQQQQPHQQHHQARRMSHASQTSDVNSNHGEIMFAAVGNNNNTNSHNPTATNAPQIDTMNMWDQPFQVPMSTPYSFNYAGQVVHGSVPNTQADQGLGFVHPPMMLPYWPTASVGAGDVGMGAKTEVDHEMSFGHQ